MRIQFHISDSILTILIREFWKCTSCSFNSVKIIQFGIKFCHGVIFRIIILITHIIIFIWIISDRIWIWDQTGCWHCWNSTWSIFCCLNVLSVVTIDSDWTVLRTSCILSLRNCGLPVVGAPNYERACILKRFTNIASHPVCCVFETVFNSLFHSVLNFLTRPVW